MKDLPKAEVLHTGNSEVVKGGDGPQHLRNELVWAGDTEGGAVHQAKRKFSFLERGQAYISVYNSIHCLTLLPERPAVKIPPTVLHTSQDNIHSCLLAGQKKKINKKEKGEGFLETHSN